MVNYDATATAHWTSKTLVLRAGPAESDPMMQWDRQNWSVTPHASDHLGERAAIVEHRNNVGEDGRLAVIAVDGTTTIHSAESGLDGMTTYTYQKNPPIDG